VVSRQSTQRLVDDPGWSRVTGAGEIVLGENGGKVVVVAGRRRVALLGVCGFGLLLVVLTVIAHSGLAERPTDLDVIGSGSSGVATLSDASCRYMWYARGGLEVNVSGKITATTNAPLGIQVFASREHDGRMVGQGTEFFPHRLTRGESMSFQIAIRGVPLISRQDHCAVVWTLPVTSRT
jgi:hypothetical protein